MKSISSKKSVLKRNHVTYPLSFIISATVLPEYFFNRRGTVIVSGYLFNKLVSNVKPFSSKNLIVKGFMCPSILLFIALFKQVSFLIDFDLTKYSREAS